jgi:hypothetical protein
MTNLTTGIDDLGNIFVDDDIPIIFAVKNDLNGGLTDTKWYGTPYASTH